jgi:hypothetical protein
VEAAKQGTHSQGADGKKQLDLPPLLVRERNHQKGLFGARDHLVVHFQFGVRPHNVLNYSLNIQKLGQFGCENIVHFT